MCCIGSITGGLCFLYFFFFFNDTATTEIYTLSLHDALPISAEDGAGWLGFFRDLTARGLTGVALVTSDAHRGLVEAIGATLPGASWQRGRTHYAANLMAPTPKASCPWAKTLLPSAYDHPAAAPG